MSTTTPTEITLEDLMGEIIDENTGKPVKVDFDQLTPEERISCVRTSWGNVPTMQDTYMLYYDVESLNNLYTVSIYDPKFRNLALYYLFDDKEIKAQIDIDEARRRILAGNPFINRGPNSENNIEPASIRILDLEDDRNHRLLCYQLGLGMRDDVNKRDASDLPMNPAEPIRPLSKRLVSYSFLADTHVQYDPQKNWTVVGYNSSEYDSSIMAKYFYDSESQARKQSIEEEQNSQIRKQIERGNPLAGPEMVWDYDSEPDYVPTNAASLRKYNDQLFNYEGRMSFMEDRDGDIGKVRLNMLNSGRHLDIALLNEKMKFVKLKRLCGMLGFQILESEKLSGPNATIESIDEFYDLLTYNASDTINLYRLAFHPVYANAFNQKAALIHQYPESVFFNEERGGFSGEEKPVIASDNVNPWRLKPDSTSAQIVAKFVAPYKSLKDIDVVSFMYPSPRVVKMYQEQGRNIEQFNVRDRVLSIFKSHVSDPEAVARVEEALGYYAQIEGKNFNANESHISSLNKKYSPTQLKGMLNEGEAFTFADIPKPRLNIPYYTLDGTPTDCYVTFSTGGIHGAQVNSPLLESKRQEIQRANDLLERVKKEFPDATEMRMMCGRQQIFNEDGSELLDAKGKPVLTKTLYVLDDNGEPLLDKHGAPVKRSTNFIRLSDGTFVRHADVLKTGSTIKNGCDYRDPMDLDAIKVMPEKDGTNIINPKFTYTSIGLMNHQDFTSYYPSMLTNMDAFYNPALGSDRYNGAYDEKNRLGVLKKKAGANGDMAAFADFDLQQKNMKLILNSASGAADSQTGKKIRLNNTIVSMRLIGQMFTWILAQLEVFKGASMPSTNTDGIYAKIDMDLCEQTLEEVRDLILVEIEPEELLLVSKDSNNRLEMFLKKDADMSYLTMDSIKTIGASGSTLACHSGPSPLYSLAHPAVIDYMTMQYLGELALLQHNHEQQHKMQAEVVAEVEKCDTTLMYYATPDEFTTIALAEDVEREFEMAEQIAAAAWAPTPSLSITDEHNRDHAIRFAEALLNREIVTPETALPWKPAKSFDWLYSLKMFQTMIVANSASYSYPFAFTLDENGEISHNSDIEVLPDVNRVFFVKPDAELHGRKIVHLIKAQAASVPPDRREKMAAAGSRPCHGALDTDPVESQIAYQILKAKGIRSGQAMFDPENSAADAKEIGDEREVKLSQIPGLSPSLHAVVINEDLECMNPDDAMHILDALDVEVYLDMAKSTFEGSWRNLS